MSNYNYTARDKSGAITRGNLTAADRASALTELRSRDMVPIAVEEGKAITGSGFNGLNVKRPAILLAGVAVALLGVWIAVRMMHAKKPAVAERKAPTEKVVKAAKAKPVPSPKVVPPKPVDPPKPPVEVAAPLPVEIKGVVPPKTNSIAMRLLSKGDNVIVPGIVNNGDTNAPDPYATFQTKSERMMSGMLSAEPGELILDISFGRDFDKDFAASLSNKIEIYPSDSKEMAAHKEDVAYMKEEMRKLVAEGKSPEEILTEFRNQHNEVAKFRSELQSQLSALKQDGKMAEAEEFAKEANKMLAPYGTRPLLVRPVIKLKKPQQ